MEKVYDWCIWLIAGSIVLWGVCCAVTNGRSEAWKEGHGGNGSENPYERRLKKLNTFFEYTTGIIMVFAFIILPVVAILFR